jgi:hypothetical protein
MTPSPTATPTILCVHVIAHRVVLHILGEPGWRTVELSLDQARELQTHVAAAIGWVESGGSVVSTLPQLIDSLAD